MSRYASDVSRPRLGIAVKLFPGNLNHVRLVMLEITSSAPVRKLLPRSRYLRLRMMDISDGRVPARALELRDSVLRFCMTDISSGMGPLMVLELMYISLTDTRADMVEDRLVSLLLSILMNVSAVRPDQSMSPVIALPRMSKYTSFCSPVRPPGAIEVKYGFRAQFRTTSVVRVVRLGMEVKLFLVS